MFLEDWIELIKHGLSPTAFKEVAIAALRVLHHRPVELTDGTGDGGVDAWITFASGRVPVQLHSGRAVDWAKKLSADIEKPLVKEATHNPTRRLIFVCAQTPERAAVEAETLRIQRDRGLDVSVVDARTLASVSNDPEVLDALRRAAGIERATPAAQAPSAAVEARLAFAFFHQHSGDFRREVARSVLAAVLRRAEEAQRVDDILDAAMAAVGDERQLRGSFRRELDALLDEGKVVRVDGRLSAAEGFRAEAEAALALQASAAAALRRQCVAALASRVYGADQREAAVGDVFDDLGVIARRSLIDSLPGHATQELARRFHAVERRLGEALKPTGGAADDAVRTLVALVADSPHGRALAAAELFLQLASRDNEQLALALTSRARLEVWLDTSVTLPMLCGKLDRVAEGWVTSEVAVELHEALSERGFRALVPAVYLEEMAAHLLIAARRYMAVVGADADLARSENFYVAHFHSVTQREGETPTADRFEEFLGDLGLPADWRVADRSEADFFRTRRRIERSLTTLLARYSVEVRARESIDAAKLPDEPARPETVLSHDRCVARDLGEVSQRNDGGTILCTEDRWFLESLRAQDLVALHPSSLLDLLALVRPATVARGLATPRELAASFGERTIDAGAAVWDLLAELEGPRLADRELLRRARAFKKQWMQRDDGSARPGAAAWVRFKERFADVD